MTWLKTNWKSVLLVASLAGNVVVAGAMITHALHGPAGRERIQAAAWSQLLPRNFFMDLGGERRAELMAGMQGYRDVFRDGRTRLRAQAAAVADALAAEPFDPAKLDAALAGFAAEGRGLMDGATQAARTILEKLTPDERKALAEAIRQRAY